MGAMIGWKWKVRPGTTLQKPEAQASRRSLGRRSRVVASAHK
jgi:hypothetical protein